MGDVRQNSSVKYTSTYNTLCAAFFFFARLQSQSLVVLLRDCKGTTTVRQRLVIASAPRQIQRGHFVSCNLSNLIAESRSSKNTTTTTTTTTLSHFYTHDNHMRCPFTGVLVGGAF